jgi:ribosomal protein S12 methylthiotransferase accessory factor YcaO
MNLESGTIATSEQAAPAAAPHRTMATNEAIAMAQRDIAALGLSAEMSRIGGTEYPVCSCVLRDRAGQVVARSTGKGLHQQSLASAYFEAVELYFTASHLNRLSKDPNATRIMSGRRVASSALLERDLLVQRLRNLGSRSTRTRPV